MDTPKKTSPLTRKAITGIVAALVLGSVATGATYFLSGMDAYVATVNGEQVSLKEFNRAYEQQKKQMSAQNTDMQSPETQTRLASMRTQIINQMVDRQIILQEGKTRNITVSDDDVDKKMAEMLKTNFQGDEEKLKKALAENGLSRLELRNSIRERELMQQTYDAVTAKDKMSDAKAKEFYEQNKATYFMQQEQVNAKHILVKEEAEAKKVMAELKAGGKWDELAKKYSTDPGSKDRGGDLGFFGKGQMVPEFEKAAWALKPEELSQPVKSQFGYHIIKGGEHKAPRQQTFEEVKEQIQQRMGQQKQNEGFTKWLEAQRKSAEIEIKPEYTAMPSVPPASPASPSAGAAEAPKDEQPKTEPSK